MKNINTFPQQNKIELPPNEIYQKLIDSKLKDTVEQFPELDYLEHIENPLLARGSEFPIIDEVGEVGKSPFFPIDPAERKIIARQKPELSGKIKKMFDYLSELDPDIDIKKFPKEQEYDKINKEGKLEKRIDDDIVAIQTVYANLMDMVKNGNLSIQEADKVLKYHLKKHFNRKNSF